GDLAERHMSRALTPYPQPLSSLRSGVPASLDRVVQKCLAKDPNERWQSAADLAAALQWIRDDSGARPTGGRVTVKRLPFDRSTAARLGFGVAAGALAMWLLAASGVVGRTSTTSPQFIPITFR